MREVKMGNGLGLDLGVNPCPCFDTDDPRPGTRRVAPRTEDVGAGTEQVVSTPRAIDRQPEPDPTTPELIASNIEKLERQRDELIQRLQTRRESEFKRNEQLSENQAFEDRQKLNQEIKNIKGKIARQKRLKQSLEEQKDGADGKRGTDTQASSLQEPMLRF